MKEKRIKFNILLIEITPEKKNFCLKAVDTAIDRIKNAKQSKTVVADMSRIYFDLKEEIENSTNTLRMVGNTGMLSIFMYSLKEYKIEHDFADFVTNIERAKDLCERCENRSDLIVTLNLNHQIFSEISE